MIDYTRKWYWEVLLKEICFKSVKSLWHRGKGSRGLIERRKRAGDFHFWFISGLYPAAPTLSALCPLGWWRHANDVILSSLQLTFWPCQQHGSGIIEILEYEKHGGIALGGSFHMHISYKIGIVLRVNNRPETRKIVFFFFFFYSSNELRCIRENVNHQS